MKSTADTTTDTDEEILFRIKKYMSKNRPDARLLYTLGSMFFNQKRMYLAKACFNLILNSMQSPSTRIKAETYYKLGRLHAAKYRSISCLSFDMAALYFKLIINHPYRPKNDN